MSEVPGASWPLEQREFRTLIGLRLDAVEFVMDYFRLQFGQYFVTVLNTPTVSVAGARLEPDKPGFKDALCRQIGQSVASIQLEPEQTLAIGFTGGAVLATPLVEAGRQHMEAVLLSEDVRVRVVLYSA